MSEQLILLERFYRASQDRIAKLEKELAIEIQNAERLRIVVQRERMKEAGNQELQDPPF